MNLVENGVSATSDQ